MFFSLVGLIKQIICQASKYSASLSIIILNNHIAGIMNHYRVHDYRAKMNVYPIVIKFLLNSII
jgi:hypothetical protein